MDTPPTPKTRYFVKELVSNKIWSTKGYPIPFDDIGDDTGLLITTHAGLIAEIELAIAKKRAGIYEITEGEVEDIKKKAVIEQLRCNGLSTNRIDQMRVASTRPFNQSPPPTSGLAVGAEVAKAIPQSPGQPLDPMPAIDPSLLKPKPSKRKVREAEVPAMAVPLVPVPESVPDPQFFTPP